MKIIRLSQDYSFKPFDCGENDLNEFLLNDAKSYASQQIYKEYFCQRTLKDIGCGYIPPNLQISEIIVTVGTPTCLKYNYHEK